VEAVRVEVNKIKIYLNNTADLLSEDGKMNN
jgi:hypothetical protein